jgi:hypothetical protein
MAYDRDGSVGFFLSDSGTVAELTETQMKYMNDETNNEVLEVRAWNSGGVGGYVGLIFPEQRNVVGVWVHMLESDDGPGSMQVSSDTTTGQDGLWTSYGGFGWNTSAKPGYRTNITATVANGIQGIRFYIGNGGLSNHKRLSGFHVYGAVVPGTDSDRLRFWHPTLDEEVPGHYFDWGNVPRATTLIREFRIKNVHPTLTAVGVGTTFEALTEASPTLASQHDFSTNGIVWSASASIGTLAPGQVSDVAYFRRNTSATAALSVWSGRIIASASSYTG